MPFPLSLPRGTTTGCTFRACGSHLGTLRSTTAFLLILTSLFFQVLGGPEDRPDIPLVDNLDFLNGDDFPLSPSTSGDDSDSSGTDGTASGASPPSTGAGANKSGSFRFPPPPPPPAPTAAEVNTGDDLPLPPPPPPSPPKPKISQSTETGGGGASGASPALTGAGANLNDVDFYSSPPMSGDDSDSSGTEGAASPPPTGAGANTSGSLPLPPPPPPPKPKKSQSTGTGGGTASGASLASIGAGVNTDGVDLSSSPPTSGDDSDSSGTDGTASGASPPPTGAGATTSGSGSLPPPPPPPTKSQSSGTGGTASGASPPSTGEGANKSDVDMYSSPPTSSEDSQSSGTGGGTASGASPPSTGAGAKASAGEGGGPLEAEKPPTKSTVQQQFLHNVPRYQRPLSPKPPELKNGIFIKPEPNVPPLVPIQPVHPIIKTMPTAPTEAVPPSSGPAPATPEGAPPSPPPSEAPTITIEYMDPSDEAKNNIKKCDDLLVTLRNAQLQHEAGLLATLDSFPTIQTLSGNTLKSADISALVKDKTKTIRPSVASVFMDILSHKVEASKQFPEIPNTTLLKLPVADLMAEQGGKADGLAKEMTNTFRRWSFTKHDTLMVIVPWRLKSDMFGVAYVEIKKVGEKALKIKIRSFSPVMLRDNFFTPLLAHALSETLKEKGLKASLAHKKDFAAETASGSTISDPRLYNCMVTYQLVLGCRPQMSPEAEENFRNIMAVEIIKWTKEPNAS